MARNCGKQAGRQSDEAALNQIRNRSHGSSQRPAARRNHRRCRRLQSRPQAAALAAEGAVKFMEGKPAKKIIVRPG